jgi:hypothetical protein
MMLEVDREIDLVPPQTRADPSTRVGPAFLEIVMDVEELIKRLEALIDGNPNPVPPTPAPAGTDPGAWSEDYYNTLTGAIDALMQAKAQFGLDRLP